MVKWKKVCLFCCRQIEQIRNGGPGIFYFKVKRLAEALFMNISAPLAVHLKLNWPRAYSFLGKENMKTLKKLRIQPNPNKSIIKRMEDQTIQYFREIISCHPGSVDEQDWMNASRALGGLYFLNGKMREMSDVLQKEAHVRRDINKAHQFDDLGIEFLPRYLPVGSIGNYEHLDIYIKAGILGLRPSKKLILLVEPGTRINNPCYLNYWKRYITVISDPLLIEKLVPLERRLTIPLNAYMFLWGKIHKSFLALGIVREQWIKEKHPPILTLSDEDYQRGWQCLKSLGMKQGDWFVCLHVRERGFKDNNSSADDFRNADINTYNVAINTITDVGGWVIRMGDSTMKPLPQMSRVIDYAHSNVKSDWMDVFLCAQCRFFIGTSSGLAVFAMSFGVPVAITNLLPTCGAYYMTSNDLFIPRLCKSREKNCLLDFSELFSPKTGSAVTQCLYDFQNIEIMKNTEEEIEDVAVEMLERCHNHFTYSDDDEELQKNFKSIAWDCGKGYGDENVTINARIGRNFLRKYATLLKSDAQAESCNTNE